MKKWPKLLLMLCFFLLGTAFSRIAGSIAADSKPRVQNQMETTIIHVDKYGIYVPNIVFYWDSQMGKQKIDALTAAAERLRNKKVVITYTAIEELAKDKRPLVLDVASATEVPKQLVEGIVAREQPQKPPATEDLPSRRQGREEPRRNNEETVPRDQSPESRPPGDIPTQVEESSKPLTKEEVAAFIDNCIKATGMKDMNAVLSCYAEQVDYYGSGLVSKDFIRKDKGYYFRNWDRISSGVEGNIVLIVTDQQSVRIAKFVSAFMVENAKKSVQGRAENIWKIQKIGNALKIIDEKQKIIGRE